jgi:hypothetical protein
LSVRCVRQFNAPPQARIVVILGTFETLPEFMRRVFVLCLMCLLPLQLLADGFNFPAPAQTPAVEKVLSCTQSIPDDDANLPIASADLSALTNPSASCLRSTSTVTPSPAYVSTIARDLFIPVPKPPPRHNTLRFDL